MATGSDVGPLVSCDWLKANLDSGDVSNIALLDVSWFSQKNCNEEYKKRHIAGAMYFDVMVGPHTELLPRNIPPAEAFQQQARAAGVNEDSHVIVYSDTENHGFFLSGRAWWTFTVYGAKKVSILNGGLQKWLSLGYPTTSEIPKIKPGNFTARYDSKYRLTFEQMSQKVGSGVAIIDSRPPNGYEQGHIPGARNLPFTALMDNEKLEMKPVQDVKTDLQSAGVDVGKPLVVYCNSGMGSCTLFLAYKLCGGEDVSLYHGGFTEWKNSAADRIEK